MPILQQYHAMQEEARQATQGRHRIDTDQRTYLAPTEDRDEQIRRIEGIDQLAVLVETYGAARVHLWLRNIAAVTGERL